MRGLPLLLFCLLALTWGTTWLALRVVAREMPPFSAAAVRFLLAALLLAIYARLAGLRLTSIPAGRRASLAALALTMIGIPYALVFYAGGLISSALMAIVFAFHPVCTHVLNSWRSRRSIFDALTLAGLSTSTAGLWVIFSPQLNGPAEELRGMVAVLGAALISSWAVVEAKFSLAAIHPVVATTWQFAGGGLFLVLLAVSLERPTPGPYSSQAWLAFAYLTLMGSCLGFVLFFRLLKDLTPIQASSLSFLTPVVAVIAGWLILDEVLGLRTLVGAGMVLTGLVLIHRPVPAAAPAGD